MSVPAGDVSRDEVFCFEGVTVTLGGRMILGEVDAMISAPGTTVLLGPSGSGKSTLLRLCNRFVVPDRGRVLFKGTDVASLDPLSLRRRVGMVVQRPTPFEGSVAENMRVAVPAATDQDITAWLDAVGLDARLLSQDAKSLSGGEAQLMCLARSLSVDPEVVLMDEPTSSLDERATYRLELTVERLSQEGTTVVWVTHDLQQARRVGTAFILVRAGRIVTLGRFDTTTDLTIRRALFGS